MRLKIGYPQQLNLSFNTVIQIDTLIKKDAIICDLERPLKLLELTIKISSKARVLPDKNIPRRSMKR